MLDLCHTTELGDISTDFELAFMDAFETTCTSELQRLHQLRCLRLLIARLSFSLSADPTSSWRFHLVIYLQLCCTSSCLYSNSHQCQHKYYVLFRQRAHNTSIVVMYALPVRGPWSVSPGLWGKQWAYAASYSYESDTRPRKSLIASRK